MSNSEYLAPASTKLMGLVITDDGLFYKAPILGARVVTSAEDGKTRIVYITVDGRKTQDVMDENGLVYTPYYLPMSATEWAGMRGVKRYE